MNARTRLQTAARLLWEHRDIIAHRIREPQPPPWCAHRGWTEFLLSLPDEVLGCCEADGLLQALFHRSDMPCSLAETLERISEAIDIEPLRYAAALEPTEVKRVKARKRRQLSALVEAAAGLASHSERIVDVGAGQGHLSRAASRAWDKEALALDREESFLSVGRNLAQNQRIEFRQWNAFHEDLPLLPSDFVVGLHACGELGDLLIQKAAQANASVLLVSCCPQKIRGQQREPLSHIGKIENLRFTKPVLGLGNLSLMEQGVETSLRETMRSRQTRHALRRLLESRGLSIQPGEEMRGVNRRWAYRGLPSLAEAVFAFRGLAPASQDEITTWEQRAFEEYGVMRRLSLPRAMLARLVEVAIVLDRAAHLEEHGYEVDVRVVFEPSVSPRNLGIFAYPGEMGRAWV